MIHYQRSSSTFWFRVFGFGLHLKDTRKSGPPLFSERHRFSGYRLGWLTVKLLRPTRLLEWTCGTPNLALKPEGKEKERNGITARAH